MSELLQKIARDQASTDPRVGTPKVIQEDGRGTGIARIRAWEEIPTLGQLPVGNVKWIVEGMVPAGGIVLVAGESGSYKTWLSLWLAKAVQEGGLFLGRKTVRTPVLYLDRENPLPLIKERCTLLGIQDSEAFRIWGGWESDSPPMIGDPRLLELARVRKPLIVFDSFIRFHGADENSATEMGRVMGELRALANAGAVPILQHHKPKAEGSPYRGSTDIKAGVDVALSVVSEKNQKTLTLKCFKNRFGEEIAVSIKPRLESGDGFEVSEDPALQRAHEEENVVLGIIRQEPGLSQEQVVKQSQLPLHKTRSILQRGEGSLWRIESGPRGRHSYYPLDSDPSFSDFQPYSPEKLKSSNEGTHEIEGEL
jgi:hypothetical protein